MNDNISTINAKLDKNLKKKQIIRSIFDLEKSLQTISRNEHTENSVQSISHFP